MGFIPNTDEDRQEMLKAIGVSSFEELISDIPPEIRLKDDLKLPEPLSEYEVLKELQSISEKNLDLNHAISFLGGGAYDHFVPSAVLTIISRSEFYTAYTPYQAEVSQGTLQAIYEYQTMICRLTGMDVANASMYDGGSALAEAVLLALGHTGKNEAVIAGPVNPNYLTVVRTYTHPRRAEIKLTKFDSGVCDLDDLKSKVTDKTACVVVQQPNFFGNIEDVFEIEKIAHSVGALFIVAIDPISLGLLIPPGEYGADIVVGEGQPLGIPLSFGGPYLGIFAVKEFLIRKLPGRLSGVTIDRDGERGFTLTLQTREQHIKREKATSNICTNQGLMMLAATVYMALMGKQGLREVATLCLQKSHYLAEEISKINGFKLKYNQPFFKEFVVQTPVPVSKIKERLQPKKILPGIDLSKFDGYGDGLMIAVTEKRTKKEMDLFVEELRNLI
ncbi:aminomethyl-transferring glycine dehydrogenase subunit GcvPA [Candidatus Kryptobacter tengchongensis]|uniref:Probable glycine dehydrogenase (decarboxylating) subunit 1 n=1 Tax=Kryptobacter tengchongensis TaxID=1643429 RepID=A0A916LIW9_KRYT1|nr:aminomethyl-transferring glycine dehydrogenase subunit GcvPA [Candidatus Kryptobacter tengchongensis]CUS98967.1 glycine dehydrogenase (decarboxylating) alpha subunit [Candidatus Kryptobacter tengchongensis]